MKNFLKLIFNRPRYINPDIDHQLKVTIINPHDNEDCALNDVFGITKERADFLIDEMKKNYLTMRKVTEAAEKTANNAKHANELFYISFNMGRIYEQANSNPLSSFLSKLLK